MRYAIIDGTDVINIIDYDEQPSNPPPGFESHIIAVQSDSASPMWTYVDGVFIAPPTPASAPQDLIALCKSIATSILSQTDWTQVADCPLLNKSEFVAYRAIVRNYAINPVADPVWPTPPTEQWSS
jgi:hypothetical protein